MKDYEGLVQVVQVGEEKTVALLERFVHECPGVKKRASEAVMARMLYVMGDAISNDLMRMHNSSIYEEYLTEMTAVLGEYLFGVR